MKVFVTGATGYVGSAVAQALLAVGNRVSGLARSEEAARKLDEAGIDPVRGSLTDAAVISEAARAAGAVIHTATTNAADAPEADGLALDAILAGLSGTNKPFLYTSGIWVIGDTHGAIADETTPLDPTPLVAWRPAHERRVLTESGHGIVIRPGIVYGQGGGIIAGMVKQAQEAGAVRVVGTGQQHWTLIHVEDLADLYVLALETAPAGSMFLAANNETHTLAEIAQAVGEAAGVPGQCQPWPLEDARQALGPFADALAMDQKVTSRKARQTLGWEPKAATLFADLSEASALH